MKRSHTSMLLSVALPLPFCVILRLLQINYIIDESTGFARQQYSGINTIITLIICAAVAAVAFLVANLDTPHVNKAAQKPTLSLASLVLCGMFIYRMVTSLGGISKGGFHEILLLILAGLSALVFLYFALRNISANIVIDELLAIPVIYYVVNLIKILFDTTSLSLVTENVFLVLRNCVLLMFIYEFANYENKIGNADKKIKKILALGAATVILCTVASLPKLILILLGEMQFSSSDVSLMLLSAAEGIFAFAYIMSNFVCDNQSWKNPPKHLA